jgi:hypothetical protein
MFNKDGAAFAYKWSARNDMWEEVGEVAGTSSGKKMGGGMGIPSSPRITHPPALEVALPLAGLPRKEAQQAVRRQLR